MVFVVDLPVAVAICTAFLLRVQVLELRMPVRMKVPVAELEDEARLSFAAPGAQYVTLSSHHSKKDLLLSAGSRLPKGIIRVPAEARRKTANTVCVLLFGVSLASSSKFTPVNVSASRPLTSAADLVGAETPLINVAWFADVLLSAHRFTAAPSAGKDPPLTESKRVEESLASSHSTGDNDSGSNPIGKA